MRKKYSAVGGQALIEGIMMKGKEKIAIAVRKQDGEIELKTEEIPKIEKSILVKIPILRGSVALISSMIVGIKALSYSAEFYAEVDEDYEVKGIEKWLNDKFGDKADTVMVVFSMIFALIMAFLLFGMLPSFIIGFLRSTSLNPVILSLFEGIVKISMFLGYVAIISRMKDVRRVFEYHGAEHKTIHCLESGEELTVENVKKFTTLHPRCGTSFLLIVFIVSIIIFTFISWNNILIRVLLKAVLLPLVAGISYEIIRWSGKNEGVLVNIISYPGLMVQKLTTKEPDEKQIEVALVALKEVLKYSEN